MQHWVINSFNESNRVQEIPVKPFLLREHFDKNDSHFEVVFYVEQIKYRYGYKIQKDFVNEEWLFYSEPKKESKITFFERAKKLLSIILGENL